MQKGNVNMALQVFCEYSENPIGVDTEKPCFSWIHRQSVAGYQKEYRIIVSKLSDINDMTKYVWDTGDVLSDDTLNIVYDGSKLETAAKYYYKVFTRDTKGVQTESKLANFTMGILDTELWRAEWVGIPGMNVPSTLCRGVFDIPQKVKKAYAFVLTPNYYVLSMNGQNVTDTVLNNTNTDPEHSLPYVMFDVTRHIILGENAVGIELGRGWPGLTLSLEGDGIGEHLFSFQMLLIYTDGSKEWHYSKSSEWKYTDQGPIVYDSIYHGETYDARKLPQDWNCPGFAISKSNLEWKTMVEFEPPKGKIFAQLLEPIRVVERIQPVAIHALDDGSFTIDMGQNFSGWARLKISGERGDKIVLSYGELVYADYRLNKVSLRRAQAVDTYILSGEGTEIYEPRFTYHGFRYVNVSGLKEPPKKGMITGCVVHSDVRRIGNFRCSNELLNQLYKNAMWTEVSNLHGIPTDCPQRDERLGWINDMTVRNECALYNYDLVKLYTKWMGDIRDAQGEKTGALADTAPYRRYGSRPCDPVAVTPALLPWNVYCFYHDMRIIEENYRMNQKWAAYLKRNSDNNIVRSSQMGDWAGPMAGTKAEAEGGIGGGAISTITPTILVATASWYQLNVILAETAYLLNRPDDERMYREDAQYIRKAFIKEFFNEDKMCFATNSQGSNTIALYMELVPEYAKEEVCKNLVKDIVQINKKHITTGNLCSRYILEVLFRYGYTDLAYDLMTQTSYPSWGYMVAMGATTMWERWEKVTDSESVLAGMASYNHPMNGAFAVCFHKYLAGIQCDVSRPGFKNVIIKPYFPKKLDRVRASIDTMRGTIASGWERLQDAITMDVKIPFNCSGKVYIPMKDGCSCEVLLNNEIILKEKQYWDTTHCRYGGTEANNVIFHIDAGEYRFISKSNLN